MNIRQASYNMCKKLISSDSREELQKVLRSYIFPKKDEIKHPGTRDFGYLARTQHLQALGFLLLERNREAIAQAPFPTTIPQLEESERILLWSFHQFLLALNRACVIPLCENLPQLSRIISPYSNYDYEYQIDADPIPFIDDDVIGTLTQPFHDHVGITVALQSQDLVGDGLEEDQYRKGFDEVSTFLSEQRRKERPEELNDLIFRVPGDHPQRAYMRHIVALLSIRTSLLNLNQICYQAIMDNHLPVLNQDAVYAISGIHMGILGKETKISYQLPQSLILIEPGDLILLKLDYSGLNSSELCMVLAHSFSHSQDFGLRNDLEITLLDEDLSSLGNLMRNL